MITTHHNDNARTGANVHETLLTTESVHVTRFRKIFSFPVIGAVYAQPLWLPDALVADRRTPPTVFVCTMHNLVYALDADTPGASPIWGPVSLGPSVPLPDDNIGSGANYKDIEVEIGILSTPVIDVTRSALFVVAMTKEGGAYHHKLHMLDVRNGNALQPPVTLGTTGFESNRQNQRAALLLANNTVYIAFASFEDRQPYRGWVFAHDADSLAQVGKWNVTPGGSEGGIWQAGEGLAADEEGNIYAMTANGTFSADGKNLGSAIVKLDARLNVLDWFSPYNNADLNARDEDVGSAGVLLVPGTNTLVGGGKEGKFYVLRRNNLGHFHAGSDSQILQSFFVNTTKDGKSHHIHGSPVYWDGFGSGGPFIYVWPENDFAKAYSLSERGFVTLPASQSTTRSPAGVPGGADGMPGGFLSLSANGSTAGTAILWAAHPWYGDGNQNIVSGILRAYDASDLSIELWNSKMRGFDDEVGNFAKFCPPTVVNGKVYLPTMGGLEGKITLAETCVASPALVGAGAWLVLAWTGTDGRLNFMSARDGQSFENKVTLPETATGGPALAAADGRLFVAWTGTDGANHLNVTFSTDGGQHWLNAKTVLRETSDHGPALAIGNGVLYLAWTGKDARLNIVQSTDNGGTFNLKTTLPQTSNTAPALAFMSGKLFLAWTGTDTRLNVAESSDGVNFSYHPPSGETTDFRPAIATAIPDNTTLFRPHLMWTGRNGNQNLNVLTADESIQAFSDKLTYRDSSDAGPALGTFRQKVFVAWRGNADPGNINVAVLNVGSLLVYGLV